MATDSKHPLCAWRERERLSLRELAARLTGDSPEPLISHASLSRIERGLQPPSWALLERIYEVSGGAVSPNDFMGAGDVGRQA